MVSREDLVNIVQMWDVRGKNLSFSFFRVWILIQLTNITPHSPCFFGLYVHNSSLGLLSWCVPVLLFLSIYLTLVVSCIYSCAHVCFFVRAQMFVISSLLYCNWQLESILHRLHIHIPRKKAEENAFALKTNKDADRLEKENKAKEQ